MIQSLDEWQRYIDFDEELIVYIDDCFGLIYFDSEVVVRWKSFLDLIYVSVKSGNVYVLIGL